MILYRDYNPEKRLDRVWYTSSNIIYSECDDRENALKVLRVVFKGGRTYQYNDVDVNDYLMFMAGGLDGSNGKALNDFIRVKKYEYVRLEDTDTNALLETMEQLKKEKEVQKPNKTLNDESTEKKTEEAEHSN